MPDLFFYRDPEEADKEERERQEAAESAAKPEMAVPTKVIIFFSSFSYFSFFP